MLRCLLNIRMPLPASSEFLAVQDAYLQEETRRKGVVKRSDLRPIQRGIYLWQGDITALQCDAIVNAANARLLGCFIPCHGCIDNQIHTFSGVQLRLACFKLMERQGGEEQTGRAKITPAFNLPCNYVLHTIGPIISGRPTKGQEALLACCYQSCLALAEQNHITSIAFCCIATGEFHFPNDRAAEIAVRTVLEYRARANSKIEVIFNVYHNTDYQIYRELLGKNREDQK